MKLLKKLGLIVAVCTFVFLMSGCGEKNVEGSLEDLMAKVYADVSDEDKPMGLMNTEVNEENVEYYLGSSDVEYESALASESAVGSIAHSVVLVRTKENADVESIKAKIKESINPRKWICVGVDEEDVIVENKGNLIVLVLVENEATREAVKKGFDNL